MEPEIRYCFFYSFSATGLHLEAEYNPHLFNASYNVRINARAVLMSSFFPAYIFFITTLDLKAWNSGYCCGHIHGNCTYLGDGAVKIYWRLKIVD